MERPSQANFKQAKSSPNQEPSPVGPLPAKSIPKNTFLRMTRPSVERKSGKVPKISSWLDDNIDSPEFWTYIQYLTKVHKWRIFKDLDLGGYRTTKIEYPAYYHKFQIGTLRIFPTIKNLTINFLKDFDLTDEYLESFIIEVCHELQLEALTFKISGCEFIKNETLKSVLMHICKHQLGLKKLSFQTQTFPRIDDEGLKTINHLVGRYLVNLQSLDLCFNRRIIYYMTHPGPLLEEFKALKGKTPLSDKGLKALGHKLGRNLINLKHLTIEMNWVKEISDKGVKTLVSEIGKDLSHLRSLELSFRECGSLTGSGMKSTANEICKNFKDLQSLSFSLDKCKLVFPNDIKAVNNKVRKELTQLKKLSLNNTALAVKLS